MPPWCRCLAIPRLNSASSNWASRSRRSSSNRRKPCARSRKPSRNAGGRSSRRPTSRRNDEPSNLFELLQAAHDANRRWHRRIRKAGLPIGDADFADIDVALGIQRDAARREEFAGLEARTILAAEPRDPLSLCIANAQSRAQIRRLAIV